MRRYFEDLRAIIERHGGTVEKFVGDAVMAVFGIPVSHEDDAFRAVRAASEMRTAIAAHGLEARIGINTGDVVVGGEGDTLVTGDAVNVAARLEQAAVPTETLIGAETRLLVRDAVKVEAVEPLALKGKSALVEAFRLLEVSDDADPLVRRFETTLVGRGRERRRLFRDYEDAVADRTCRLFSMLGPAGIGKSRLVADFLERVGDTADVLRGRCLSYGEGITYWPLVEMLIAIGVEPRLRHRYVAAGDPACLSAVARSARRRAAAGRPDRRPAVGRAPCSSISSSTWPTSPRRTHLSPLRRTNGAAGRPAVLGRRKVDATSLLLEPLAPEECAELIRRARRRRFSRR